jgi:hypothetical protein
MEEGSQPRGSREEHSRRVDGQGLAVEVIVAHALKAEPTGANDLFKIGNQGTQGSSVRQRRCLGLLQDQEGQGSDVGSAQALLCSATVHKILVSRNSTDQHISDRSARPSRHQQEKHHKGGKMLSCMLPCLVYIMHD